MSFDGIMYKPSKGDLPELATPRSIIKTCLFCCDLRAGVLVIGTIQIVWAVFNLAMQFPLAVEIAQTVIATGGIDLELGLWLLVFVPNILQILFALVGIYGAARYRPKVTTAYFVFAILYLLLILASTALIVLQFLGLCDAGVMVCDVVSYISLLGIPFAAIVLQVYFILVINSFRIQLKDTFAGRRDEVSMSPRAQTQMRKSVSGSDSGLSPQSTDNSEQGPPAPPKKNYPFNQSRNDQTRRSIQQEDTFPRRGQSAQSTQRSVQLQQEDTFPRRGQQTESVYRQQDTYSRQDTYNSEQDSRRYRDDRRQQDTYSRREETV